MSNIASIVVVLEGEGRDVRRVGTRKPQVMTAKKR